jgi:hypothetical protein
MYGAGNSVEIDGGKKISEKYSPLNSGRTRKSQVNIYIDSPQLSYANVKFCHQKHHTLKYEQSVKK